MAELYIKGSLIKTIIFDFDGTLAKLNIDFNQMRKKVMDLILSYGISENDLPVDHILETIDSAKTILEAKSQLEAAALINRAYTIIEEMELIAARSGELFPQIKEFLHKLSSNDISVGIITRNCAAAIFTIFPDILSYCPVVISRDTVEKVKPHPEHLNTALQLLHSQASNTLMIGDHPLDIKTGKAAGTYTAGVLTGNFPAEDFQQAGADIILSRAIDILDMIN
jgi:phosphoglycolate phosphatase